jgi:hypothetical protein
LGDQLAFHPSGRLLSVRFETQGKIFPPNGEVSWKQNPRVIRLRDLSARPVKPIAEIQAFNRSVTQLLIAREGAHFAVEGLRGSNGDQRSIRAYDGLTGRELWKFDALPVDGNGWLRADPEDRLLALRPRTEGILVEMPSGRVNSIFPGLRADLPSALGPGARYRVRRTERPYGHHLSRGDSLEDLIVLGLDIESLCVVMQFDRAGKHFGWGNVDGSVCVCDLTQLRARLASIGLGW